MRRHATFLLLVLILIAPPLAAFDTGHHSDATRAALKKFNRITTQETFNEHAIAIVQVSNWLTDYYTNTLIGDDDRKKALEKLHFDNLTSTKEVNRYWNWLAYNTQRQVQRISRNADQHKRQNKPDLVNADVREFLVLLGMSLHAVQDFYSHSNWVEEHPRVAIGQADGRYRPYNTDTWWSSKLNRNQNAPWTIDDAATGIIFTGFYANSITKNRPGELLDHGGYDVGVNHDSYVRPRWEEAYVFAYAGSVEWARAVVVWAGPDFQDYLFKFRETSQNLPLLESDVIAAWNLSEWISLEPAKPDDGHWKGKYSGNKLWLARAAFNWTTAKDSPYVVAFKKTPLVFDVSSRLYDNTVEAGNAPVIPPVPLNDIAVSVKTESVQAVSFDTPASPRFYATIEFRTASGSETFIEAMHDGRGQRGVNTDWHSICFVPADTDEVSIVYRLFDKDQGQRREYNIGVHDNDPSLHFRLNTGDDSLDDDFVGVHVQPPDAIVVSGVQPQITKRNMVAQTQFWAWSTSVKPPAGAGR